MTWSVGLGGRGGGFFRKRVAKYGAGFFCGRFRGSGPAALALAHCRQGLGTSRRAWHSQGTALRGRWMWLVRCALSEGGRSEEVAQ